MCTAAPRAPRVASPAHRPGSTVPIAPGTRTRRVAPAGADPVAAAVLVARAEVFTVEPDPVQTGGVLLTVLVPEKAAPAVVAASGAAAAAVVKVPSS